MMIHEQNITPEERRALGIAALTALVAGVVGGAVTWAFEEAKLWLHSRREHKHTPPSRS